MQIKNEGKKQPPSIDKSLELRDIHLYTCILVRYNQSQYIYIYISRLGHHDNGQKLRFKSQNSMKNVRAHIEIGTHKSI